MRFQRRPLLARASAVAGAVERETEVVARPLRAFRVEAGGGLDGGGEQPARGLDLAQPELRAAGDDPGDRTMLGIGGERGRHLERVGILAEAQREPGVADPRIGILVQRPALVEGFERGAGVLARVGCKAVGQRMRRARAL